MLYYMVFLMFLITFFIETTTENASTVLTSQRLNNGNPRLVYCHVIELKNRKEQSLSDHKVHNKQELHTSHSTHPINNT